MVIGDVPFLCFDSWPVQAERASTSIAKIDVSFFISDLFKIWLPCGKLKELLVSAVIVTLTFVELC